MCANAAGGVDVTGRDGARAHLAAHVAALLRPGRLVLKVDARGARLDEHLRELHHSGQPAVARVAVGDDGREVVRAALVVLGPRANCGLPRPPLVELKGAEQLVDLVGHGCERARTKNRGWRVEGGQLRVSVWGKATDMLGWLL